MLQRKQPYLASRSCMKCILENLLYLANLFFLFFSYFASFMTNVLYLCRWDILIVGPKFSQICKEAGPLNF